jgi:hypothetical protein
MTLKTPKHEQKQRGRPIEWTDERIEAERLALEAWIADPNNYYLDAFCNDRGYVRERMEEWSRRNEPFADTLDRARRTQEIRLVTLALNRKHDGNFTRFVLANRAGWRERTEVATDLQTPLLQLLASVDGSSKAIIGETKVLPPEQLTSQPDPAIDARPCMKGVEARKQRRQS